MKQKTVFCCSECGNETVKWSGRCLACGAWDSLVEVKADVRGKGSAKNAARSAIIKKPKLISELDTEAEMRFSTGIGEFDRVLGGGIVPGSVTLLGGDPGIGKSTLLMQTAAELTKQGTVLYVTGEESASQLKLRAERLGVGGDMLILAENDLSAIESEVDRVKPAYVMIDSIQTMYSADCSGTNGSISQIREATSLITRMAKRTGAATFIVGHVTKDGAIAGPRILEHMVDTVLYFEGDRHASYRILRAVKNRFGSTNEIGVFEMRQNGLVEVENPSEYMLSGKPENASGSVVACSMEGTRPILLEIQALVARTNFGMPRRTAAGTDYNRVNLLMAVLEKRLGMNLGNCDAYVNIAGGIKMNEPAIDLGIVMALVSSYRNRPIDEKTIVFGEVGLSGEVRAVNMPEQRVAEAKKLGFETCILPEVCMKTVKDVKGIKLLGVKSVNEAVAIF